MPSAHTALKLPDHAQPARPLPARTAPAATNSAAEDQQSFARHLDRATDERTAPPRGPRQPDKRQPEKPLRAGHDADPVPARAPAAREKDGDTATTRPDVADATTPGTPPMEAVAPLPPQATSGDGAYQGAEASPSAAPDEGQPAPTNLDAIPQPAGTPDAKTPATVGNTAAPDAAPPESPPVTVSQTKTAQQPEPAIATASAVGAGDKLRTTTPTTQADPKDRKASAQPEQPADEAAAGQRSALPAQAPQPGAQPAQPALPGPVQPPADRPPADMAAPAAPPQMAEAPAQVTRPVPAFALPMTIASLAKDGGRQFEIRLDPAELGRIDVSLSVDNEGAVRTHIVVERPETAQLLRNDAPRLEQALADAGLKSDAAGVSINLKNGNGQSQNEARQPGAAQGAMAQPGAEAQKPAPLPFRRLASAASRLDLVL